MTNSSNDILKQTPLHSLHEELGARMVPFAGYSMPVQYEGVKAEHLHTRASAGFFDVSHMGQILVTGSQAAHALEALLPVDLVNLPVNRQTYALLTNDEGGIRDDLMILRLDEESFLLVVNAACKDADMAWLQGQLNNVAIEHLESRALIALQGPASANALMGPVPGCDTLQFMTGMQTDLEGHDIILTRSGYTGEDGFEISLPASMAEAFCRKLLENSGVQPVGLGARDTLRLEAGLCLYGHDIDDATTPVSAGLQWSISPSRRNNGDRPAGFPGAELILAELDEPPSRKRTGLLVNGKAPVREGTELVDADGEVAGIVTSGSYGPSIGAPVAMGYLNAQHASPGTELKALVRNKALPVTVTTMPFVKHRYVR